MNTQIIKSRMTISLIMVLFSIKFMQAQSQGPNNPAKATELQYACLSCPGSDWMTWLNVEQNDTSFATCNMMQHGFCFQNSCSYSRTLEASKYQFSIPGNATIKGIEVFMMKEAGAANSITDTVVHLMFGGDTMGNNNPLPGLWSINDSMYIYGGDTNLWGTSWTSAMINDSSFGVAFRALNMSNVQAEALINWIGIQVFYSLPTGIESTHLSSQNTFNLLCNEGKDFLLSTDFAEENNNPVFTLYDILGQAVFKKGLAAIPQGKSTVTFQINSIPAGVYLAELSGGDTHLMKKIVIGY